MTSSRFPTDRSKSALELVASGALDDPIFVGTEHRLVPSTSHEGSFYVTSLDSCTCMDSKYRPNKVCKHRIALKLQHVLDEAEADNRTLEVVA